jgi:hypothetical protein
MQQQSLDGKRIHPRALRRRQTCAAMGNLRQSLSLLRAEAEVRSECWSSSGAATQSATMTATARKRSRRRPPFGENQVWTPTALDTCFFVSAMLVRHRVVAPLSRFATR